MECPGVQLRQLAGQGVSDAKTDPVRGRAKVRGVLGGDSGRLATSSFLESILQ